MKTTIHHLSIPIALAAILFCASTVSAQTPSGQWDFDNGNLSATVGQDMSYHDGPGGLTQLATQFGTTTLLGIPDIHGSPAKVMQFPAATNGMGYLMTPPGSANGGGSLVNEWTLIMDVLYPTASDKHIRPIIDTDGLGGPNIVVDSSDGVGYPPTGPYVGSIAPNTWYRLGIVVANAAVDVYLNGAKVGSLPGFSLDGVLGMVPSNPTLILGNTTGNAAVGYINSLQIWGVPLNPGQMLALGGPSATNIPTVIPPVPSFILSRTPDINATGISPLPNINVVLNQGSTVVNSSSIQLSVDGAVVPANITASAPNFTITYAVTNILDPGSTHTLELTWQDGTAGSNSNTWNFTVCNYQNITLPAPIYLETFDEVAEGGIPAGWTVTNWTDTLTAGLDLNDTQSDSYKDWVVVSTNTYATVYADTDDYTSPGFPEVKGNRRQMIPPIVLNGQLLSGLAAGNLIVAESDQRGGSQVQVMFTSDYDLTGRSNAFLSFHNINEQNQDNICSVEYSIDQGVTWLPLLYMLDDGTTDTDGSDVVTNNGQIDVFATFNTARNDQAHGLAYGTFIGATVSTNLIPYIRPCRNDDPVQQKRIEVFRLPLADGQPKVRFRLMQAGTASWFFSVDDFGLYSINTPVINTQPLSQSIDVATPVTFSVAATSASPLQYQWQFNAHPILNATNSSYTINSVSTTNGGQYQVSVINSDGTTRSAVATLTVVTVPVVTTQPISLVSDPGESTVLSAIYRGGRPIGSVWYKNGVVVGGSSSTNPTNTLSFGNLQTNDSAAYTVIITNAYGSVTSAVAQVTVYLGPITNSLVTHLTFDGDFNDSSGRGNNAQYAYNGIAGDTTATFAPGFIGQAFQFTTLQDGTKFDYATLGYPDDLKLGDSTPFSVSFWVNYTNQSDDLPFISNKDWNSSGNPGWGIFPQSGGDFRANVTGPNGGSDKFDIHPTQVLRDGNWHNVVLSFVRAPGSQASYVNTYADGVMVNQRVVFTAGSIDTFGLPFTNEQGPGNGALPNNQTTWAVNIGQDGTGVYHDQGNAYNIAARIDDLGIWRRALTANEVAGIYAAGRAGKDLSQAVVVGIVPPTVSSSPISQVVSPGANVTFTVTAVGTPPLTYTWYKGQNPVGGNSTNLTLSAVTSADQGAYFAIVRNGGGSSTSAVAQLTVYTGSVTQELVAHLKFDGDYKDSSGAGTDGAAAGTPTFEAGMIGQAVHLHSAGSPTNNPSPNNYVTLGNPAQLNFGTNDFSISFWAKILSQNDDKPFISNKDWSHGSNPGWAVATEGDGMKWNFKDSNSSRRDSSDVAPQLEDGQWHHVLVSFQRSSVGRIYVDGQLMDASNLSPDPGQVVGSPDTALAVNVGQDGTGLYTDGTGGAAVEMVVDDLGIWRRVITPQEATAIYAAGQSGKDLSQAVVGAVQQPNISVGKQGNSWVISYTGTLYSSSTANGTYAPVPGANSPYTIPSASTTIQFYRSHQ